jgi:hypothetical protein
MHETYGTDLDFDANDLFDGHFERIVQSATEVGVSMDSPVVRSAARLVREVSPRYRFRLRVSGDTFVTGQVDRYAILIPSNGKTEFPEPARSRFVEFLRSLSLGSVNVEG